MFVYSIPKEKDMIGISIITQIPFPQLQCMSSETISIILKVDHPWVKTTI